MDSGDDEARSQGDSSFNDRTIQGTNSRIRHHSSLSLDSSNSPDAKKSGAEISAVSGQSLSMVGWLEETILIEQEKKRIAKGVWALLL